MTWMNEWDIEGAMRRFKNPGTPNLYDGIVIVDQLAAWTNRNSDGWHSWPKPSNAASRLMELLQSVDRWEPVDITEAELDKAVRPIKAFLTKMTKSPYPYGGSAKQAASAVTLKNWIEEYLKTTRADLSRRLI